MTAPGIVTAPRPTDAITEIARNHHAHINDIDTTTHRHTVDVVGSHNAGVHVMAEAHDPADTASAGIAAQHLLANFQGRVINGNNYFDEISKAYDDVEAAGVEVGAASVHSWMEGTRRPKVYAAVARIGTGAALHLRKIPGMNRYSADWLAYPRKNGLSLMSSSSEDGHLDISNEKRMKQGDKIVVLSSGVAASIGASAIKGMAKNASGKQLANEITSAVQPGATDNMAMVVEYGQAHYAPGVVAPATLGTTLAGTPAGGSLRRLRPHGRSNRGAAGATAAHASNTHHGYDPSYDSNVVRVSKYGDRGYDHSYDDNLAYVPVTYKDSTQFSWKDRWRNNYQANRKAPGKAGLLGAVAGAALATRRDRAAYKEDRWINRNRNNSRYVQESMVGDERRQRLEHHYSERRLSKVAMIIGGVLAYKILADPGDHEWWLNFNIPGFQKLPDQGIDMLGDLFGDDGDQNQGDGNGYDVTATNRSPWGNDDPTPPHIDKSYDNDGLGAIFGDLIPAGGPFGDGDGLSPPRWWPGGPDETIVYNDPGDVGQPTDAQEFEEWWDEFRDRLDDVFGDWPVGDAEGNGPDDGGEGDAGGDEPPATGGNPALNGQPDISMPVMTGAGVENLGHELGHNVVGFENWDGADTHELAEYLQGKYGEDYLVNPDGTDATYIMQDGNVGLRAPGSVRFANEAIEEDALNFIRTRAS